MDDIFPNRRVPTTGADCELLTDGRQDQIAIARAKSATRLLQLQKTGLIRDFSHELCDVSVPNEVHLANADSSR
jgi:hypothetical protein